MDFTSICRTCLSSEDLSPIFVNSGGQNQYNEAIFIISGIKVEVNDGYPQQVCKSCKHFLDETWKFRYKCLETEQALACVNAKQDIEKVEIQIEIDTDKVVKMETNEDEFDAEYVDFDILEEDKPLNKIIKQESNLTKLVSYKKLAVKEENFKTKKKRRKQTKEPKEETLDSINFDKRINCILCNKNLSIHSIRLHMAKTHGEADERRNKCELCDKHIMKAKMKRHLSLTHNIDKGFKCSYCKSEFPEKQLLVDHVITCTAKIRKRNIHDPGRQMVECDVCNKKMQRASLKMHKAITHAGLGPVCEHCGKRFGNKLRLKEHYRARHGYEKLKCALCEFTSASALALKNHERRHLNEKPFVCESCGAKFHAAYLLAQHRQSHRTEKLLKCDLCPATFKANNSLHTHKRSCHSDTSYGCTMCSRAYRCRHYAVRHMRHFHNYRGPVPPLKTIDKTVSTDTVLPE